MPPGKVKTKEKNLRNAKGVVTFCKKKIMCGKHIKVRQMAKEKLRGQATVAKIVKKG